MFNGSENSGVKLWVGLPDCQAAHDHLLSALQAKSIAFLPSGTPVSSRQKGNLGEFVAMTIGHDHEHVNCRLIAANAHDPLSDISRPDLDLLWFFFGDNSTDDFTIVQEVKTTGDSALGYGNTLIEDYQKLFGTDIQFSLQSRLAVAANKMESIGIDSDFCCRVTEMAERDGHDDGLRISACPDQSAV